MRSLVLLLVGSVFFIACQAPEAKVRLLPNTLTGAPNAKIRTAAFVVADGVYNSELMAPYDVLHHTLYRDSLDYIAPFIVNASGTSFVTFEGIEMEPHFSFAEAPKADIIVIPSTEGSMARDLQDTAYMGYLRRSIPDAEWVLTVCDGAFPLAETGALAGRVATTFPGDRTAFAKTFPSIDVRFDKRLIVDGKYLTSVGGAMSYEPAFWLVEHLWDSTRVSGNARGLVWPWNKQDTAFLVID
ncbi:MAG: DJ-1/PfpI family protein [Saprospiraceae bacterium]